MKPVLFSLPSPWGAKPFYSFGVMLGIAIIVGWLLTSYIARKYQPTWNLDKLFNLCVITALGGVVGARVFYVVTHLDRFDSFVELADLSQGGMVSYGALLGGALSAYLGCRVFGFSLLAFGDVFTPALTFGLGIGRLGCYLYGCDFGKPLTKAAPAFIKTLGTFPRWPNLAGSAAWKHHTEHYGLSMLSEHSLPVHPTQLYDASIMLLWLPCTLIILKRNTREGLNLLLLVIVYTSWRFVVEFIRDDPQRTIFTTTPITLSLAQLISLACFIFASITLLRMKLASHHARISPI